MPIVNTLAIPVIMTHGFTTAIPDKQEIDNTFRTFHWVSCYTGNFLNDMRQRSIAKDQYLKEYYPNSVHADAAWHATNAIKDGWINSLLSDPEQDYFYVEIYAPTAFTIFPFEEIVGAHLDKIISGETHVLICMSLHGYHNAAEHIYKDIIVKYGIDPTHVTLRQESWDAMESLELAAYKYNLPQFNLECVFEMEYQQQQSILGAVACPSANYWKVPGWPVLEPWPGTTTKTLEHKEYEKKFLSFNGAWRFHRNLLIYLLVITKTLNKGYVSYNIKSPPDLVATGELAWQHVKQLAGYEPKFLELLDDYKQELIQIDSILLDVDKDADHVGMVSIGKDITKVTTSNSDFYKNTYFSVVTETSFPYYKFMGGDDTDVGRILSEKIFKPIGMKHPFIIVTNPHALELLREIGYKTFHPLIDETYDKIKDPIIRMMMIANEIKKLCALEGDELTYFLTEAKKICEYNYNVLLTKTKFIYNLKE